MIMVAFLIDCLAIGKPVVRKPKKIARTTRRDQEEITNNNRSDWENRRRMASRVAKYILLKVSLLELLVR